MREHSILSCGEVCWISTLHTLKQVKDIGHAPGNFCTADKVKSEYSAYDAEWDVVRTCSIGAHGAHGATHRSLIYCRHH